VKVTLKRVRKRLFRYAHEIHCLADVTVDAVTIRDCVFTEDGTILAPVGPSGRPILSFQSSQLRREFERQAASAIRRASCA